MKIIALSLSGLVLALCALQPAAVAAADDPIAARDIVLSGLLQNETAGKRLLVHPVVLPAGTPILTWHGTALTTPASGFVVFVDDAAYANFEHPCRYVFVDREGRIGLVEEARTPPREAAAWLEMETEAFKKLTQAQNVRAPRPAFKARTAKTPRGGDYYAVLMSGGYDQYNNHVRYWNDLSNIYVTLVDIYGYYDGNIIVLCSDGLNPAVDQSNGLNSDPDLDGDGDDDIMYSCILSNIDTVFAQMASILTADDQLFVFTTDHGGSSSGWSVYLNLWNAETLADSHLASLYTGLPCPIITTMEQCFSGGFEDNLDATSRVFSSAAAYTEYSWAMPPDYVYDTYAFFWTAAVKGEDAYGNPCNADLNGDEIVSMYEAFVFAEANDFSDETPQYNSNPAGLGETLFLGEGPVLTIAFPEGLPGPAEPPGAEIPVAVQINDGLEVYLPGTAFLYYRSEPASSFTQTALTPLGGGMFEALLPAPLPGDEPEYFFSAQGNLGTVVLSPYDAPASLYGFDVALIYHTFHDDFEADTGWTVENINLTAGAWQRCDPNSTTGDQVAPVDDNPYGTGTMCYVTGNGPEGSYYADYDVDGGPTRLISPTLDLTFGDPTVSCCVWFYGRDGDKPFTVDVSGNDGTTWTNVYTTVASLNGWTPFSFRVADYIAPTTTMKVRFCAEDQPNSSIVEAGVDDFKIEYIIDDPGLYADGYAFSGATGCYIRLRLDEPALADRGYLLLGTFSGVYPGTPLPKTGLILPLNRDNLTDYILDHVNGALFQNFRGTMDSTGKATAILNISGPGASSHVGKTIHFAFTTTKSFDYASNPIAIHIDP